MPGSGPSPVDGWAQRAEGEAVAAARRSGVRISAVADEQATRLVADLGDQVWGARGTFAPNELRALAFSGNPVHLAVDEQDGGPVGFAVGFVGWAPELHVHSHQAGVVASHRRRGVGYALKLAQRSTCLAQGLYQMRWTFDPLVRRNVAFNLNALGARAVAFYPDFYGVMSDLINASDASDRLEARWDLARPLPATDGRAAAIAEPAGSLALRDRDGWPEVAAPPEPEAVLEVPGDYETIRRREPERGGAWRQAVRTVLTGAYAAGLRIGSVEERGYRLVPDEEGAMNDVTAWLRERVDAMVELTGELVAAESPSDDTRALGEAVDLLTERATDLLGVEPVRLDTPEAPALTWSLPAVRCDSRPVVLLAHLDTVWAAGTLARWPFTVEDDQATGPGAFDMKAGLVQGLFALVALAEADADRPPVVLVVTTDEEIGSPVGRQVVEDAARDAAAVLVLEPSVDGRLKVARKGVSNYDLQVTGRSAHAGLEPERGVNALLAAAQLTIAVADLAAPEVGTTVTPTLAGAGTTRNTVPAAATVALDVRATTVAEQQRVDAAIRALRPDLGATLVVDGGPNRPPMEEQSAAGLVTLARRAAERCGLPPLETAQVGGGSDGNFTAAMGVPTLDGLGAVGAGAHAEGEHVVVSAMPERAALVAELIVEIGRSLS